MSNLKKLFYFGLLMTLLSFNNAKAEDVKTGTIFGSQDAAKKCPQACEIKGMAWNGNWSETSCTCSPKSIQPVQERMQSEIQTQPTKAQSDGTVSQTTPTLENQIFPESFSEVKTCGADAQCRAAARDKIDTEILNAINEGSEFTPIQKKYINELSRKQFTHDLTKTQDDIVIYVPKSVITKSSSW